jgi:REP element-mobilizing transposase RayT
MEGEAVPNRKHEYVMADTDRLDSETPPLYPTRQHPAHPRPVKKHNQPVILFITLCIKPRIPTLANVRFHHVFLDACVDADQWLVGRYLIMPDHIHLFTSPASKESCTVTRWNTYLKERMTKKLNPNWTWQSDCWDTQMRTAGHYQEKWNYVRDNPVRSGLAGSPNE